MQSPTPTWHRALAARSLHRPSAAGDWHTTHEMTVAGKRIADEYRQVATRSRLLLSLDTGGEQALMEDRNILPTTTELSPVQPRIENRRPHQHSLELRCRAARPLVSRSLARNCPLWPKPRFLPATRRTGVEYGWSNHPRTCKFGTRAPAACTGEDSDACLTKAQWLRNAVSV